MGINGLWELVRPTGTAKSLADLVEENGYSYEGRQSSMLRFGVDISVMFDECLAAVHAAQLYAHFHGGPLRVFFYKLCKLLKCPAIFIFVFDGPERPSMKRGRKIKLEKDPWWFEPCKEFITSMGFHVHQAPGEAEAELGCLSKLGTIDAVISNDGDAFIFGACQVLRRVPKSNGVYSVYTMDTIERETTYKPDDMLLLALLSGGDYSKGIQGCGVSVVTALVKCGFGSQLGRHLAKLEDIKLDRALDKLVNDIKHELCTNSRGFLSSRQPTLARRIGPEFLSPTIRSLYMNPVTSWSPGHHPPDDSLWTAREPDLLEIVWLCMKHLGWNTKQKLGDNLHNTLLEGLFIQALASPDVILSNTRDIETNSQIIEIVEFKVRRRHKCLGPPWGRLCLLATTARDVITTIGGIERDLSAASTKMFSFMVWLPLHYLPPSVFSLLPRPQDGLKWVTVKSDDKDQGDNEQSESSEIESEVEKDLGNLLEVGHQTSIVGQKRHYSAAFQDSPQEAEAESSSMGLRRGLPAAQLPSMDPDDYDLPEFILTHPAIPSEGDIVDISSSSEEEAPKSTTYNDEEVIDLTLNDGFSKNAIIQTVEGEVIEISD